MFCLLFCKGSVNQRQYKICKLIFIAEQLYGLSGNIMGKDWKR